METKDNNIGAIYCATGSQYLNELETAVDYLWKVEPSLEVCVFTDKSGLSLLREKYQGRIEVIEIPNPTYSWNDKLYSINNSPFLKTIYMDTDTIVIRPIVKVFLLALNHFDLLAQPGMGFNLDWEGREYPKCISQFNTGVIIYRRNDLTEKMLKKWSELRKRKPESHDQPTFREALILSEVRFAPLSNEYNYHGTSRTVSEVSIIHLVSQRMRNFFRDKPEGQAQLIQEIKGSSKWSFHHGKKYGHIVYNGEWQLKTILKIVWIEIIRKKYLNKKNISRIFFGKSI